MAEMPPNGANQAQAPPAKLPPGVYFSPTRMECLGLLNRWIAGDKQMRDTRGYIFPANVYGESPDVLHQRHPPASVRDGEYTWWFMSQTKFQSQGGASKRAARSVTTGGRKAGYWRLEQKKEKLKEQSVEKMKAEGVKNCFGYYVDGHSKSKKKDKTPWLMQEFTSANDDGTGKGGMPALYRVYVTPHATDEELIEIFGEEGVKLRPDGKKKPARAMVPEEYFDGIAALLPEGSVRGVVNQENAQAPPPLPLPAPEGLLYFYSQQEQYQHDMYLGQHEQQQGQYLGPYQYQQDQYLGQYKQQQYEQDQYISQYEQEEEQQQQGPSSMVAPPLPPPASPGLIAELAADNLSMPMADIMRMIDEPAEMVIEQPAVTINGEEPNWESFDNIVDDDELANFNEEG